MQIERASELFCLVATSLRPCNGRSSLCALCCVLCAAHSALCTLLVGWQLRVVECTAKRTWRAQRAQRALLLERTCLGREQAAKQAKQAAQKLQLDTNSILFAQLIYIPLARLQQQIYLSERRNGQSCNVASCNVCPILATCERQTRATSEPNTTELQPNSTDLLLSTRAGSIIAIRFAI